MTKTSLIELLPVLLTALALVHFIPVDGLECYACAMQETNTDKCIKTTKQCEEHQDRCMSTLAWGAPPKWMPYGHRVYYVSKECETAYNCDVLRSEGRNKCKRDWYRDWQCFECCTGDLCNYYVTLGANRSQSTSLVTVVAGLTVAALAITWR